MTDQTTRYRSDAGYDHALFPFDPIDRRPPLTWPGDARTALGVWVYFEHMELDPPEDAVKDPRFGGALGSYFPDFQNYSRREFGNRVGIFRVLDILDGLGLKPTICANALAAQRHPYIVDLCLRRGYGVVAHGWSLSRMISSRMSEQQEIDHIGATLDTLETAFGVRPTGWAGQDHGESPRTPELLARAGIQHVIDWPNDDVPYLMQTTPPLVSIPNQSEWDDAQLFAVRKVDAWRYPEILGSAFEVLHAEGGRMLGVGIHPWIFGQAHRIRYLEQALSAVAGRDDVWYASSDEIAQAVERALPG
jgi:peptidoglycan/xylan/chitin deacetylase (PgdA/CDA1 family)